MSREPELKIVTLEIVVSKWVPTKGLVNSVKHLLNVWDVIVLSGEDD